MLKSSVLVLTISAMLVAGPVLAEDDANSRKVVFETAVRIASDDAYMEIVRQAWSKGWRFTIEQIESGSRRHFEEFKLRLIDDGYLILSGEAGT